jgi:hypothetical protein
VREIDGPYTSPHIGVHDVLAIDIHREIKRARGPGIVIVSGESRHKEVIEYRHGVPLPLRF